jgi:ubiquitin
MLLFDLLLKNRPDLSKSSQSTYKSTLDAVKKYFDVDSPKNADFLFDYKKLQGFVDKYENKNTKKSKIIALIVLMSTKKDQNKSQKKIMQKLQTLLTSLNDNYFKEQSTQEKSEKQDKNFITYEEYVAVLHDLKKDLKSKDYKEWSTPLSRNNYYLLTNYLLVRFYQENYLRNDVADTRIIQSTEYKKLSDEKKDESNYLILEGKTPTIFQMNKFKTRKSIGRNPLELSKELSRVIKIYLRLTGNKDFFITKEVSRDIPISPNDVSKIFNRTFKLYFPDKKVSTSVIRHLMTSKFSKDNGLKSMAQQTALQIKVAKKFQHSLSTNQGVYRKN